MIIEPWIRENVCLNAHPKGCYAQVEDQIGYVTARDKIDSPRRVLVIGAGPLGLFHIIVSKALGAQVIVSEVDEARRAKALEVGADVVLNPAEVNVQEEIKKLTEVGADVVLLLQSASPKWLKNRFH